MIEIYYTGAAQYLKQQPEINLSLGGFISSTMVPNGVLNNLFSGLPVEDEYICLAIKNETGFTINLDLWFEYPLDPLVQYSIGSSTFTATSCGDLKTEKLQSKYAMPYTVQFTEATVDNKFSVQNFDNSDYLAIFVKRELIQSQGLTNEELYERHKNGIESGTKETMQLVFSY